MLRRILKDSPLVVDDVTVDLTIATTAGAGGSVKVGVPPIEAQAGGKLEQVRSSRLVVQLGQPSASIAQGYEDVLADFKRAESIIEAQRQLADGIAAGKKIAPQKLTLEIVFGVTNPSRRRAASSSGSSMSKVPARTSRPEPTRSR